MSLRLTNEVSICWVTFSGHLLRVNILSKEYIMAKRRKDNPVAIKYLRKKQRRAEKSKAIPFHIAHNYKSYVLTDGTVFWARDDEMAEDYRQFVGDIEQ